MPVLPAQARSYPGQAAALPAYRLSSRAGAPVGFNQSAKRTAHRVTVRGKFLYRGDEKLYLKGVTYGPFAPQPDGSVYGTPEVVDRDFAEIAENGINCIRVYST